jgi:hypothetical protein
VERTVRMIGKTLRATTGIQSPLGLASPRAQFQFYAVSTNSSRLRSTESMFDLLATMLHRAERSPSRECLVFERLAAAGAACEVDKGLVGPEALCVAVAMRSVIPALSRVRCRGWCRLPVPGTCACGHPPLRMPTIRTVARPSTMKSIGPLLVGSSQPRIRRSLTHQPLA